MLTSCSSNWIAFVIFHFWNSEHCVTCWSLFTSNKWFKDPVTRRVRLNVPTVLKHFGEFLLNAVVVVVVVVLWATEFFWRICTGHTNDTNRRFHGNRGSATITHLKKWTADCWGTRCLCLHQTSTDADGGLCGTNQTFLLTCNHPVTSLPVVLTFLFLLNWCWALWTADKSHK